MKSQKYIIRLSIVVLTIFMNQSYAASDKEPSKHGQEIISSKGFSYQIGPPPDFVDQETPAPKENESRVQGDTILTLNNIEVSLLGREPQEYAHIKSKPLTATALQNVSQVYITFNPAYQKLILHQIRIWRGGKAIDLTHSVKLDLIRRENDLDRNMYDGNITAVGVLPDIRINDVIDVAYTVVGQNPIFGDHFAQIYSLTREIPVAHFKFSLIAPKGRPLKIQPPQGTKLKENQSDGVIRYTVEEDGIRPLIAEDNPPDWYQPLQLLQVSEYQDWPEVSKWANDLFKVDGALSPELRGKLQQWKDANLPKDQLAVEVLRWVQSQIRYFGIELGVNSHLPAPPNLTVERKFGDCKDKSLLLATLLTALDIDAKPTLASMSFRRNVGNMMPSPALFNHAIVRVGIKGKTYWLDPTRPPQYGNLDTLGVTDFGSVLPLGSSGQLQSASYPLGFENLYEENDHLIVSSFSQPVQLITQFKANFDIAENFRYAHDSLSKEEFNNKFQGVILHFYPNAHLMGDAEFADDKINNQVKITLKYSIGDYFKYEPGRFNGAFFATELLGWSNLPNVPNRTAPYALPRYTKVRQTIEIDYPEEFTIKNSSANNTKSGEFWTLTTGSEINPQKMRVSWTLQANKESVPSQKIGDFISETRSLREQMAWRIKLPVGILTADDKRQVLKSIRSIESTYGNSSSGRVAAEVRGAINLIQTTRDIESGKLGGNQLAEAYKIRSVINDDQANVQQALEDIHAAEKLIPGNYDSIVTEAEILLGNGQVAAARQTYESALKMAKSAGTDGTSALRGYGEALHYLGQNSKAKEVFDQAILNSNGEAAMYSAIWRFIVSGHDADASSRLQSTMSTMPDHAWPFPVGEMLLGKLTPEQLINTASSPDKGIRQDQYCEAYFYIGQKYLLDNKKADAEDSFQKSLDQGVMLYMENDFSLLELGKKRTREKKGFWARF